MGAAFNRDSWQRAGCGPVAYRCPCVPDNLGLLPSSGFGFRLRPSDYAVTSRRDKRCDKSPRRVGRQVAAPPNYIPLDGLFVDG
jgi:hypothetical protein